MHRCCPARRFVHAGSRGPMLEVNDLDAWRDRAADVRMRVFDGGHFFLHDDLSRLPEALMTDLAPWT
jgi:surfactin synthase thioesterase subunit